MFREQLEYILHGGETQRWHTTPTLRPQMVNAHSFNVAWLCFMLYGGNVRVHLLIAALAHDLPEHLYGDMPAPAKRGLGERLPGFREAYEDLETKSLDSVELNYEQYLTENERKVLAFADVVEYLFYCTRERRLGNQTMGGVANRIITGYIAPPSPDEVGALLNKRMCELRDYAVQQWNEANGERHVGR